MKYLIIFLFLAIGLPAIGQDYEVEMGKAKITQVKVGKGYLDYYTWDIGFCYLTGIDSIGRKKAWLTVAHLFAERSSVSLSYFNKDGQPETWYLNDVKYLGSDICQFNLSRDSIDYELVLPWPSSGFDSSFLGLSITSLGKDELVHSLVDGKSYNILGAGRWLTTGGEISGLIIDRECAPGDCGSGFISKKSKKLYITIRGMGVDQQLVDILGDRAAGVSTCTFAVPVGHN